MGFEPVRFGPQHPVWVWLPGLITIEPSDPVIGIKKFSMMAHHLDALHSLVRVALTWWQKRTAQTAQQQMEWRTGGTASYILWNQCRWKKKPPSTARFDFHYV